MRKLHNLTLHIQGELELRLAAEAGFALQLEPHGVKIGVGSEEFQRAVESLAERLRDCLREGVACLVGGHTALWIAASLRCQAQEGTLPTICFFDTERQRDEQAQFVFAPVRLGVWENAR